MSSFITQLKKVLQWTNNISVFHTRDHFSLCTVILTYEWYLKVAFVLSI